MKFSIRDILWLTVAVALAVGWWIDRSRFAVPAADYRRLKAEEAQTLKQQAVFFEALRRLSSPPETAGDHLGPVGPDGLRRVPGNKDYQFPPNYPLYYGPVKSPPYEWDEG